MGTASGRIAARRIMQAIDSIKEKFRDFLA
jgi:hypothetical protein